MPNTVFRATKSAIWRLHRAARGCATAPRRRASSKTQKSESFYVARRCLQALPANHAKCHVLCNEKCYLTPTQGCARLRDSAQTARQLQNAKKCDSFCVARRGLQALSPGAASRRCLPALPPGAASRRCLQGLPPRAASRGSLQALPPGAASRRCLQALSPGAAFQGRRDHRFH